MIVTLLLHITDAIPISINNVILIKKRSFWLCKNITQLNVGIPLLGKIFAKMSDKTY